MRKHLLPDEERTTPTAPVTVRVNGLRGRERVVYGPNGQLGFPDSNLDLQRAVEAMTEETPRPLSILRAWRAPFRAPEYQERFPLDSATVLRTIPRVLHPYLREAEERSLDRAMTASAGGHYRPTASRYAHPVSPQTLACMALGSARYWAPGYNRRLGFRGRTAITVFGSSNPEHFMVGTMVGWLARFPAPEDGQLHDALQIDLRVPDGWKADVWERGKPVVHGVFVMHYIDDPRTTESPRFTGLGQDGDGSIYIERAQVTRGGVLWLTEQGRDF